MVNVKELAKKLKDLSDEMTNLVTDLTKEEAQAVIDELQTVHNFKFPEPKIIEVTKTAVEEVEASSFNVRLLDSGPKKLDLVKKLKEVTTLGLKDAKALIDSAPCIIFENLSKVDAEMRKKEFEDLGGKLELT